MNLLTQTLNDLVKQGCIPGIYARPNTDAGVMWRAHVNISGNYWADDTTPLKALRAAIKLWKDAGKPMDGAAGG